jgi:hypothetical protein
VVAAVAVGCAACDGQARRLLSASFPSALTEGQETQVTIVIKNPGSDPMVPLALSLYVLPDPTEYLVARRKLGEVEYYKPLQATEVRHLQTLDRIEADHVRDGDVWRHVPDSRFLHPRILMPGQTLSETFAFQAMASHHSLLYCDLYYVPWASARGRLFVRTKPQAVPPDAERYTEVFSRVDEAKLGDTDPQAAKYLLYRPARIHDRPALLATLEVKLKVTPQAFTYRMAARRARLGARTYCYFAPANVWVFEYADDGTWFVAPDAVTRLKGKYADLIADLARRNATVITLTAPRQADDKLRQLLEKAGFADAAATGPSAVATIPTDRLLPTLEQAEALGYLIELTTWRPMP